MNWQEKKNLKVWVFLSLSCVMWTQLVTMVYEISRVPEDYRWRQNNLYLNVKNLTAYDLIKNM